MNPYTAFAIAIVLFVAFTLYTANRIGRPRHDDPTWVIFRTCTPPLLVSNEFGQKHHDQRRNAYLSRLADYRMALSLMKPTQAEMDERLRELTDRDINLAAVGCWPNPDMLKCFDAEFEHREVHGALLQGNMRTKIEHLGEFKTRDMQDPYGYGKHPIMVGDPYAFLAKHLYPNKGRPSHNGYSMRCSLSDLHLHPHSASNIQRYLGTPRIPGVSPFDNEGDS